MIEVEGLYYLCSENKGADRLHGDHGTELCFSHDTAHIVQKKLQNDSFNI